MKVRMRKERINTFERHKCIFVDEFYHPQIGVDMFRIYNGLLNAIVIKNHTDVDAFTSAIIKLLDDEQYYNMLRKNALKEIKKNHLEKNVSETWEEIFKRLDFYE